MREREREVFYALKKKIVYAFKYKTKCNTRFFLIIIVIEWVFMTKSSTNKT